VLPKCSTNTGVEDNDTEDSECLWLALKRYPKLGHYVYVISTKV
jgi:hypothetical protein